MKKAVLFDFDGTIVDTQLLYDLAASKALTKVDGKYDFEYCSNYFNGRGWKDVFYEIGKKEPEKNVKAIFEDALKIASNLTTQSTLPSKNIFEVLNILKQRKIKFAICSNSKKSEIEKKLKIARLDTYFAQNLIFTFETTGNAKPKPDVYMEAMEFLKVSNQESIIIEDSQAGLLAGINAQTETLFYIGGGHHAKNSNLAKNILETLNSYYIKSTITDLKEIVNFI